MSERLRGSEDEGQVYIEGLSLCVRAGGLDARAALEKLSKIAAGGHLKAQEQIRLIDEEVTTGELTLPNPPKNPKTSSLLRKAFFIVAHPLLSLRTMRRQTMVAIEEESPPHTSNFEDFPGLPVSQAAEAIRCAEKATSESKRDSMFGAVLENAWPPADQRRMKEGRLPLGYPEHPHV